MGVEEGQTVIETGHYAVVRHPHVSRSVPDAPRNTGCSRLFLGGTYVNRAIGREGKPGITIGREEFLALGPDYLFTPGFLTSTVEDTLRYCSEHALAVPAVERGQVYSMHPSWDFGSPRWVLGLMTIANILHPDRFSFAIEGEADAFYRRFYGVPYRASAANRSFAHPGTER